MTQAHIFYSGTVQGIGFRYTVARHAKDFNLQGWVKNLSDGRVEILVEGPAQTIEKLCQETEKHFEGYIDNKEIQIIESQGKFTGFHIAE